MEGSQEPLPQGTIVLGTCGSHLPTRGGSTSAAIRIADLEELPNGESMMPARYSVCQVLHTAGGHQCPNIKAKLIAM